jgi:hypothetical protein
MPNIILTILLLASAAVNLYGQHENSRGQVSATIFSNFSTTVGADPATSAFEILRAYIGYSHAFNENYSARLVLDVGDPHSGRLHHTAFLKYGYVSYARGNIKITSGMIATSQFKVQENLWGLRYVYKSFQDEYGFESSADLGINASYRFHDMLSTDVIITNGDGYRNIQANGRHKSGAGITFSPGHFILRGYYDRYRRQHKQTTLSLFAGYGDEKIGGGLEYNFQRNHGDFAGNDLTGVSAWGSYLTGFTTRIFARFDRLTSNLVAGEEHPGIMNDVSVIIAGLEYSPVRGVKIAPNYRAIRPAAGGSSTLSRLYLNLELKF